MEVKLFRYVNLPYTTNIFEGKTKVSRLLPKSLTITMVPSPSEIHNDSLIIQLYCI